MRLLKIKAMLVEKGIKTQDIADIANVNRVTVSVVLTGRGRSRNIEQAVAKALGVPHEKLWDPLNRKAA